MGFNLSKPVPVKDNNQIVVHAQHHLINYFARSFYIRNLVSRKRRRMLVAGYDLDMTYISDRILAMSFPSERIRAIYRNPLSQVKSVLDMRHWGHYKVYNLCIEESYNPEHFHGRVERFPFDDNHVPSLEMMKLFCESVHSWLSSDPKHVAVIHCMAGKGRTGLMVSAYLVYSGRMSAEEALHLYAQRRTTNNEGVSIPSQRRYVGYWESVLSFHKGIPHGPPAVILPQRCSRELRRIRLYDTSIESIFFVISELQEIPGQMYRPPVEVTKGCCRQVKKGYQRNNSPRYYISFLNPDEVEISKTDEPRVVVQMDTESPVFYQKTCLDCYFDKPINITGDVCITFYQKMYGGRLFYACFNTAFIKNSMLQFTVQDLDKVGTKARAICGDAFGVELLFGPANVQYQVPSSWDDYEYD